MVENVVNEVLSLAAGILCCFALTMTAQVKVDVCCRRLVRIFHMDVDQLVLSSVRFGAPRSWLLFGGPNAAHQLLFVVFSPWCSFFAVLRCACVQRAENPYEISCFCYGSRSRKMTHSF